MPRADILWRAGVVIVAMVAAALGAPPVMVVGGLLLGLGLAAERLGRRRGRGPLDAVLIGVGGLLVALVLVGVVLGSIGSTPLTLGERPWALGLGAVALAGLLAAARGPRPVRSAVDAQHVAESLRALPWVAASAVVVVVALSSASHASDLAADRQPGVVPLQMSFGAASGPDVDVVVESATRTDRLEIRVAIAKTEVTYPLFVVGPDQPHTTRVSLPMTGRYVVTLLESGTGTPLRSLTLDR